MATVVDTAKKIPRSSNIKIGGETVKLFNDEAFKKVRKFRNVADDAISPVGKDYSGKNEFDFNSLRESGGKGGDLMGFTKIYSKDRSSNRVGSFIVKEMKGDDHKSLTTYVDEYCQHVSEGNSFITCFYFHFQTTRQLHIDNTKVKKTLPAGTNFIVMANCMPGADKVKDMYDLKGSADDKTQVQNGVKVPEVHKRCWSMYNIAVAKLATCHIFHSLTRTNIRNLLKHTIYL